jgi:hypothetical protein
MFNILTRTNNRPKYFFLCHQSIKSQDYKGTVKHYVSIDDPKTMEYIDMYRNRLNTVNVERKQKMQPNSFPYNSYLDAMLSKIEDGWVMVLDDDDKFMKNESLSIISEKIKELGEDAENCLLLWKVKIGTRICPSIACFGKQIRRNDISNIGFAFHVRHKDKAHWPEIRGGDFKCIEGLSQHLKCIWIDDILTCTNSNAGNFGNQRDIALNNEDTQNFVSFCNSYTEVMGKMNVEKYLVPDEKEQNPITVTEEEHIQIQGQMQGQMQGQVQGQMRRQVQVEVQEDEKVYMLKESSIKAIAEMLSSAINSKKLYEDIINQNYLVNKSIPHIVPIKQQNHSSTNAKEILQQLEKEDETRASLLLKKSELLSVSPEVNTDYNIIVITRGSVLKEKILNYLNTCGIDKKNVVFVSSSNIDFNSSGLINAAKLALENNYEKVIVIHENSLVIKNFEKEMQVLCSYQEYKDSDIIFCGLQGAFGRSIPKTVSRNRVKKKSDKVPNIQFDPDYYCALYEDLRSNNVDTQAKARDHWEKYGYDEGRIGKRQLIDFDKSMPINEFNGVILSKNACLNISECFDDTLISIMLLKEFSKSSYVVSPYLFESETTLKIRKHNTSLYKR